MTDKTNPISVRLAVPTDAEDIAAVHQETFVRQQRSLDWIRAGLAAYPRLMTYVVCTDGQIAGYAVWAQKSGFREQAVLELEQAAVRPHMQGQGLGKTLLQQSLAQVRHELGRNGQTLKALWVGTAADNPAQKLYQNVLGVQTVAALPGLYRQPELIMLNIIKTDSPAQSDKHHQPSD